MTDPIYDLVVIGSGPAGYVASIRAAQLGLKVACIEKYKTPGGTCLNVGCIPSKALLESSEKFHECVNGLGAHGIELGEPAIHIETMMARKDKVVATLTKGIQFLFKKNKIDHYIGTASFKDPRTISVTGDKNIDIAASKILIATGSKASSIAGVTVDKNRVCTSTEALSFSSIPKHLVVIGAGAIGLELGSVWARLGSQVTVIEYFDRVLPLADRDVSKQCQRSLKKLGLKFILNAKVLGVTVAEDACAISVEGRDPIGADRVLVATGRTPNTQELGLDGVGVQTNERGFITVDTNYETSQKNIYAVGDVTGNAMLAHKASEEGIACVEKMVTGYGHVNYEAVPSIVYIHPEAAWVGQTEQELTDKNVAYKKGQFNFKGNGRAMALGETDGLVKILAHAKTDRILGVHIVGPRAGDLLAEAVTAMELCSSAEDLARIFHAHPTLGEVIKEAALAVDKRAIHG